MHLTILSRKAGIYTTKRLAQAARLRGAKVRVLDPLQVEMHLDGKATSAFYQRRKLRRPQPLLLRRNPRPQRRSLAMWSRSATCARSSRSA